MGKGGYYGGSTIIHPGSGWFSGGGKTKSKAHGKGQQSHKSGPTAELERQAAARLRANAKASRQAAAGANTAKSKEMNEARKALRAQEQASHKARKTSSSPFRKLRPTDVKVLTQMGRGTSSSAQAPENTLSAKPKAKSETSGTSSGGQLQEHRKPILPGLGKLSERERRKAPTHAIAVANGRQEHAKPFNKKPMGSKSKTKPKAQKRRKTSSLSRSALPKPAPVTMPSERHPTPATSPKNLSPPVRPARISAAPIVARLSRMPMPDLLATWSNAVDKLANDHSPYILAEVRTLISAIDAEWETRAAQFISDEDYFAWPGTDAHPGDGSISAHDWQVLGPLRYLGYQAGTTADLAAPVRRAILSRVFEGAIPPAFPPSYLRTWGQPGSVLRLQKMAESIASFVRNGKRRDDGKMDAAVADWEADLQFLYDRYYVARFRFAWPTLRV